MRRTLKAAAPGRCAPFITAAVCVTTLSGVANSPGVAASFGDDVRWGGGAGLAGGGSETWSALARASPRLSCWRCSTGALCQAWGCLLVSAGAVYAVLTLFSEPAGWSTARRSEDERYLLPGGGRLAPILMLSLTGLARALAVAARRAGGFALAYVFFGRGLIDLGFNGSDLTLRSRSTPACSMLCSDSTLAWVGGKFAGGLGLISLNPEIN